MNANTNTDSKNHGGFQNRYTIFGYHDMDGGIAAAICLRHLREKYAECHRHAKRHQQVKWEKKFQSAIPAFAVEPVPRSSGNTKSLAGLLRIHHRELGIPAKLIQNYDDFIDLAEISQQKRYADKQSEFDFSSFAVKLHALFHTTHSAIDAKSLYKLLVYKISENSDVEDLFDSNVLFASIIEYEKLKEAM